MYFFTDQYILNTKVYKYQEIEVRLVPCPYYSHCPTCRICVSCHQSLGSVCLEILVPGNIPSARSHTQEGFH